MHIIRNKEKIQKEHQVPKLYTAIKRKNKDQRTQACEGILLEDLQIDNEI